MNKSTQKGAIKMKSLTSKLILISMLISCCSVFAGAQEDLFTACLQNDIAGVKSAVDNGADVNALNENGQNALACAFFSPEITQYLIEKGCNPNGGSYPALIQACNNYSVQVAEMLIKAGADPNKKAVIDPNNTFRMLVAKEKAKGKNANQAMINAWSSNIGKLPMSEISALQVTLQQTNCVPCLKLLLDNGAKMDVGEGTTPLHVLMTFSNTAEARKEMFAKGAPNMEMFGIKVPAWYSDLPAEHNGTPAEMLDLLLQKGPNLNVVDKNGYTPLLMALDLKKPDLAKGLLTAGADAKIPFKFKSITKYPITYAAYLGDADVMKLVLEKGADFDVESWEIDEFSDGYSKGFTPLLISVMKNHLDCAKVLIEKGAKPTEGIEGHMRVPSIDCTFRVKNKSAMYFAIENNNPAMVQLMMDSFSFWSNHKLEIKAPINKQNYNGERCNFLAGGEYLPGMYAKKLGFDEIAELLATKGL
jgi:ankyrin repeat protein